MLGAAGDQARLDTAPGSLHGEEGSSAPRRPASATRPRGAGAPKPAGPAAPGGSFPAPPLLCSFLHGLLPFLLLLQKPPPPRLPCPLFLASPYFLGSAFGWTLPQELGRAQGLFWPLSSLSPSTVPSGHADTLGATCRVVSALQTVHRPLTSGLCSPRLSCPVLLASPQPHQPPLLAPPFSYTPAPRAVCSSHPRYFVSLLFWEGRARISDLCCSVWCRV